MKEILHLGVEITAVGGTAMFKLEVKIVGRCDVATMTIYAGVIGWFTFTIREYSCLAIYPNKYCYVARFTLFTKIYNSWLV